MNVLIELETAAQIAAEVSTHGLSIKIEITTEGVVIKGKVVRGGGMEAEHMHIILWHQLHASPGLISPAVKRVEAILRQ